MCNIIGHSAKGVKGIIEPTYTLIFKNFRKLKNVT